MQSLGQTDHDSSRDQGSTLERIPTFVNLAHVQSAASTTSRTSISYRRPSANVINSDSIIRVRSRSLSKHVPRNDVSSEEVISLTKSATQISGHQQAYDESGRGRNTLPQSSKDVTIGTFDTITELPTPLDTPFVSRRPSLSGRQETEVHSGSSTNIDPHQSDPEGLNHLSPHDQTPDDALAYPDVGVLASWRGSAILACVCGAQLMDNVFMTGVNICLPAIQKEFDVSSSELQWLISAYTLTFGGFLLFSGVLADRYGRKQVFCGGMLFLSIWTMANGFATSFIQMAIFRALQGIGAAATVPSSVGIISSYYVSRNRSRALSMFGAAGGVGFCIGLILGGFLTATVGWRYLFWLCVVVTGTISIIGWFILPKDNKEGQEKPKLDFAGVALSASGLILLSFVLSGGGEYGWGKAFIIILLITAVALLGAFTWLEKKVSNPIMPLSLWKLKNFAALWICGFMLYGSYQTIIYYITLIAQEVQLLSASQTAIRFLPMGIFGFFMCTILGYLVDKLNTKALLMLGMLLSTVAPISAATMPSKDLNFWKHIMPASMLGVAGVTIGYCTITVVLLSSVPNNVKSLAAGMINTAYQIGAGFGLALSTAVVQAVDVKKGRDALHQYETGLWCCVGFGALSLISAVCVKETSRIHNARDIAMH